MEYLNLIANWLIFGVACVAAVIARNAIISHRRTARQQATLEFIHRYNDEDRVSHGHQVIRNYNDTAAPEEYIKPGSREFDSFLFLMNMFEILAIGLKRGIYDEDMALDMFGEDLRNIYADAAPLVAYIRKTGKEAFRHSEKLAERVQTSHKIE